MGACTCIGHCPVCSLVSLRRKGRECQTPRERERKREGERERGNVAWTFSYRQAAPPRTVAKAMLPPIVVGFIFLVAVLAALAWLVYTSQKSSKPSDFFSQAVADVYQLELGWTEIDAFYDMKDKLQEEYGADAPEEQSEDAPPNPWLRQVPVEQKNELKKALLRRTLAGISRMEQVQKDKPGHAKLWHTKLVSEKFWESLLEAEKSVNQEIESCVAEAEEIETGWKEHIFPQALHLYRLQRQQQMQKEMEKQEKNDEKRQALEQVRAAEMAKRKEIEEKVRQERAAQKAMEQLIAEEEKMASVQSTKSNKSTGKKQVPTTNPPAKTKAKKK
mmetsp:Transcript_36971/g.80273  ORF Transcript_36971/g.80273 Transcript_36971/m.80273 type:complete len:332 (+) Transcript_36971:167-1162(+)